MNLWHDDIRRPPRCTECKGSGAYCEVCGGVGPPWVWVRTNEQAKVILEFCKVDVISLDHDLGGHDLDPDEPDAWLYKGPSTDGTGLDLVDWMCETGLVPDLVIIHSMNAPCAIRMQKTFRNHGYDAILQPFRPDPA